MFKLGEIFISEKVNEKVSLELVCDNLKQYLKEWKKYTFIEIDEDEESYKEKRVFRSLLEKNLHFKKEFIIDNKLVMYVETYKDEKGTLVLEGQEYLKREMEKSAFLLSYGEKNFVNVALQQYEKGTKYEINTSLRILMKLKDLENKKKYFIRDN